MNNHLTTGFATALLIFFGMYGLMFARFDSLSKPGTPPALAETTNR
jgi:hypothetical protein